MRKKVRKNRHKRHESWHKHCPTGKEWFTSELSAMRKINHYKNIEDNKRKPVRAYLCEFCGDWHLTSKPYREDY